MFRNYLPKAKLRQKPDFKSRFVLCLLLVLAVSLGLLILASPQALMAQNSQAQATELELKFYEEANFLTERARPLSAMTDQEREEDYAAFWDIIEHAFPMTGVIEAEGRDLAAIKESYQAGIYQLNDQAAWINYFQEIIQDLLGDHSDLGHLTVVSQASNLLNSDFQSYTYYLEKQPEDPWITMMDTIFQNPHVHGFYDLKEEVREPDEPAPFLDVPDNLWIEYNLDYDYAYVKINSFLNQNPADGDILQSFFLEAEGMGVGNIIIDVRGNGGGYNDYWLMKIVSPNISEPLSVTNYGLYKESKWIDPYLSYYVGSTYEEDLAEYQSEEEYPTLIFNWNEAEDGLPAMPELKQEEVEDLEGVMEENIRIAPSFEEPLFSGEFWILSDGRSYSASEYFISFAKRTGFATVVGEESAGDGSTVITLYNALPNSGLLFRYNAIYGLNADGSNSEMYASKPDVEIQAGEDAFYKVLDLIAKNKE